MVSCWWLILITTDIDECELMMDDCGTHATCKNMDGGFNCTCNPGFDGNGTTCSGKSAVLYIQPSCMHWQITHNPNK